MRRYGVIQLIRIIFFIFRFFLRIMRLNIFIVWLGLEIINFSIFLFFRANKIRFGVGLVLVYYWVSCLTRFGLIRGMFIFFYYDFGLFILLFLMLKIGLVPFIGWIIYVYRGLDWMLIFILSIFLKIPFLYFIEVLRFSLSGVIIFICFFRLLYSVGGIVMSRIKVLLGFSGILFGSDFILSYFFNYDFFFLYIFYYRVFLRLILFFFSLTGKSDIFLIKGMSDMSEWSIIILFLVIFGLPLFVPFFLKLIFIFYAFSYIGYFFLFFYFLVLMIGGVIYYRVWGFFNFKGVDEYSELRQDNGAGVLVSYFIIVYVILGSFFLIIIVYL